jgi:hypothetical protein
MYFGLVVQRFNRGMCGRKDIRSSVRGLFYVPTGNFAKKYKLHRQRCARTFLTKAVLISAEFAVEDTREKVLYGSWPKGRDIPCIIQRVTSR